MQCRSHPGVIFATPEQVPNDDRELAGNGDGSDAVRYKFANEMSQRLARFTYQLLGEDLARPQDDVVIRMLLGARADKNAQRIMHNAYRRVLTSFESFDTTVLLNPH